MASKHHISLTNKFRWSVSNNSTDISCIHICNTYRTSISWLNFPRNEPVKCIYGRHNHFRSRPPSSKPTNGRRPSHLWAVIIPPPAPQWSKCGKLCDVCAVSIRGSHVARCIMDNSVVCRDTEALWEVHKKWTIVTL